MGQGTPGYSGISSAGSGGGGGGFILAQNGLSAESSTVVVLGQNVGAGLTAALNSDREIPMQGFGLLMSGDGRLWVGDQTAETYLLGNPQVRVRAAIAAQNTMLELSNAGGGTVFDNGIFFSTDNAPVFIDAGLPSANTVFLMKSTTDPTPVTGGTTVNFYLASTNSVSDSEIVDQEVMAFIPESVSGLMPIVDIRYKLQVGTYVTDVNFQGANSPLVSLGRGVGVGFSGIFGGGNVLIDPDALSDVTDLAYSLQVWDSGNGNTIAAIGDPNNAFGYALIDRNAVAPPVYFKRAPNGRDNFATDLSIDTDAWRMFISDEGIFTFNTTTAPGGFNFIASSVIDPGGTGPVGADFNLGGLFDAYSNSAIVTSDAAVVKGLNAIQSDTTAADTRQYGAYFGSIGTKSAGANNQVNIGLFATVGNGDVNFGAIINGNTQIVPFGVTFIDTGESLQVLGNVLINNTQPINTLAVAANTTASGSFGTLNLDTNNNFSYYSKLGFGDDTNSWGFFVQTDQYENTDFGNGMIDFEAGYHFSAGQNINGAFTGGIITRLSTYLDSDSVMFVGSNSAAYGAALFVSNNMVPNGGGVGTLTIAGEGTVPMPIVVARTDFNNGPTVNVSGGLGMAGFLSDLTSGNAGSLDIFTDYYAGAGINNGAFTIGTRYGFYVADLFNKGGTAATYAFYSAGQSDEVFFAGRTVIGSSPSSNGAQLQLNGNLSILPLATASSTINMDTTVGVYVYTGSTSAVYNLPDVATSNAYMYFVKNRGTGLMILTAQGSDKCYTTAAVTTVTVNPGEAYIVACDGSFWNIQ